MIEFFNFQDDWKKRLYLDWILPIQTIVCLILCITFLNDSKIKLSDLEKGEGFITGIKYFERATDRSRHPRMDTCLTLKFNNGHVFTLNNKYRKQFDNVINIKTLLGRVDYYFKTKILGSVKLYQLKVDNKLIKEITDSNNESINISVLTGFLFFVSFIGYLIWRYTEASPENKYRKKFDTWIDRIFD